MSVLANNTHANLETPLYMSARPSTIDLSGAILSITTGGNLAVNGSELVGPEFWYLYPAGNNQIFFDNGPNLESVIVPPNVAKLLFNGEQLATVNDIPSLEDWSQYPANSNVNMAGYALNNASTIQATSTMRLGSMVTALTSPSSAIVSSLSTLVFDMDVQFTKQIQTNSGISTTSSGVYISSLATVNLSTGFTLMSSLQFSPSAGGFTFNLGLGDALGSVFNYAKGTLTALAVSGGIAGATSLATGIYGMVNTRQQNYIYPSSLGIVETVNGTSQLQVSTLATPQTSYYRQISSTGVSTSVELITSSIISGAAVRTVGDPYQMPSTGTSSFIQAFGQWQKIPDSEWSLYPAISTVSMGANQIDFTVGGISRSIREGAGFQNNPTVKSVEFFTPGAGTDATAARSASYIFTKFPAGQPAEYASDTLLFALNISNPTRLLTNSQYGQQTIAYLSDVGVRPSFDIYVAPNGNDTTGDGSTQKPFLTIGAAITYRATLAAGTMITIHLNSGTYTENITLAANTSLTGETGTSDPAPDPVVVVGTITSSANGIGLYNLTVTGTVSLTGTGNTTAINNVTINAAGTFCVTGNSTCSITSCRFTNSAGGCINVTLGGVYAVRDSVLTISTAGANVIQATGSVDIIRSSVESTNTSGSPAALVRFINSTTTSNNIRFSRLNYTSTTTDIGGNKCCVQYSNTGINNSQIAQCVFECVGATTGTPNVQCIQYNGSAAVNLNYGNIQAVGNAHNIAPAITKTSMTTVP